MFERMLLSASVNILAGPLLISIVFNKDSSPTMYACNEVYKVDGADPKTCEITTASGLKFTCYATREDFALSEKLRLSSFIVCMISARLLFWSLLTFLW